MQMVKRGLLLEYVVGGGLMPADIGSISPSLLNEGWGMLSMLANDWCSSRFQGELWKVTAPIDPRATSWFDIPDPSLFALLDPQIDFLDQWRRLAAGADAIILIAPESHGELIRLASAIDEVSDARLGCRPPFLERTSNKLMMAEYISDEYLHPQTLTPRQFLAYAKNVPSALQRDWVMKPIDGAGCDGIWKGTAVALSSYIAQHAGCPNSLVQHYLPGQPASVAAWITETGRWWLPPVWQDIRWENLPIAEGITLDHPTYRGGSGPIAHEYWDTIHAFANRILDLQGPGALGWVGIDFVFNLENGNPRCAAIEVNPRWTTSYAGLRRLVQGILLEKFLETSLLKYPLPQFAPAQPWRNENVCWSV